GALALLRAIRSVGHLAQIALQIGIGCDFELAPQCQRGFDETLDVDGFDHAGLDEAFSGDEGQRVSAARRGHPPPTSDRRLAVLREDRSEEIDAVAAWKEIAAVGRKGVIAPGKAL